MTRTIMATIASLLLAAAPVAVPASAAAAGTPDALALTEAAATLAPNRYLWADPGGAEPVSILISIPDQRAYVFRGEALVAASTVSTGKDGNETPLGSFTILQKKEKHRSNLYDDAPMPFMQRLTWDGVAIHAGRNPGFPASHGCIRVPTEFARKLFAATELGATVEVTDMAFVAGAGAPMSDAAEVAAANAAIAEADAALNEDSPRLMARR